MVEQNDPDNIEAIFYSAYGKAMRTLLDEDIFKRQAAFKVLGNCISVIDDHYKIERREENRAAIMAMSKDLGKMMCSNFVYTQYKNGYGIETRNNKGETLMLFVNLLSSFKESIDNIQKVDDQLYLHEALITLYDVAIYPLSFISGRISGWRTEEKQELRTLEKKIKQEQVEAYWRERPEEKEALTAELEKLIQEQRNLKGTIQSLAAQIQNVPSQIAYNEAIIIIEELEKEKHKLGMFKGKEKKELQVRIDEKKNALESLKKQISEEQRGLNEQITECRTRNDSIFNDIAAIQSKLAGEEENQGKRRSITIGSYYQTGDMMTELEWVILTRRDSKALVVSKNAINCKRFHTFEDFCSWRSCSLNKWLNNGFLNGAFTADELKLITKNPSSDDHTAASEDIFLLSAEEAAMYFTDDQDRQCEATTYAINQGAEVKYIDTRENLCSWWLRTTGDAQSKAAYVDNNGAIQTSGRSVHSATVGVRPAMWINLDAYA